MVLRIISSGTARIICRIDDRLTILFGYIPSWIIIAPTDWRAKSWFSHGRSGWKISIRFFNRTAF